MRLSVKHEDHRRMPPGYCAKVMLDGIETDDVVMADEEEGLIEVLARDADGRFILNQNGDSIVHRFQFGSVVIVLPVKKL